MIEILNWNETTKIAVKQSGKFGVFVESDFDYGLEKHREIFRFVRYHKKQPVTSIMLHLGRAILI